MSDVHLNFAEYIVFYAGNSAKSQCGDEFVCFRPHFRSSHQTSVAGQQSFQM